MDLIVSIGVNESSGTSNCFAHCCIARTADGAKPPADTGRAAVVRVVPVRTSPMVRRLTTNFFSASGAGSSCTKRRLTSRRFLCASNGSAMAMPAISIADCVRRILRSATSTSVPNALVPASSIVLRTMRSAKNIQTTVTRAPTNRIGRIPCQRKNALRAGPFDSSGGAPLPAAGGPYRGVESLRTEPAVDIIELGGRENLVEMRLTHAFTDRRAIPDHREARRKPERHEEHEPHDDAAENNRVVEVCEREDWRVVPRRPEGPKRHGVDQEPVSNAIKQRIEHESDGHEHGPGEHAGSERHVEDGQ